MERFVIEEFGSRFIYRVKYFGGRHVGLMDECIYIYIEHKVCALRRVDDEYDEKI